jgi:protein-tyrosine phosphatase
MGDNHAMRAYYEAVGFQHVCDRLDKPRPASLYEKQVLAMAAADPGALAVGPATPDDADSVFALLEAAAEWLVSRGIRQWLPGEVPMDWLLGRIAAGEVWVATLEGALVGSFRLIWSDEPSWGVQPDDAGYVHGLVVNRGFAGRGIGRRLLERAEQIVAEAGKPYLRLDCLTPNDALVEYYLCAGFRLAGEKRWEQRATQLFEKRVGMG